MLYLRAGARAQASATVSRCSCPHAASWTSGTISSQRRYLNKSSRSGSSQDTSSASKTSRADNYPGGKIIRPGIQRLLSGLRLRTTWIFDPQYIVKTPRIDDAANGIGGRSDGKMPRSDYESSTDRGRTRRTNFTYFSLAGAVALGVLYFGRDWHSDEEAAQYHDPPSGWISGLIYGCIRTRMSSLIRCFTEPTSIKLLPTVQPAPPYTLVLSLEELMIFSEWTRQHGWRIGKRPGLDYFLLYLSQYYELVLWTSMPQLMADPIVRELDPYHIISRRLFRDATLYDKGRHVKDLSYLNRPVGKVVIMDTDISNVKNQSENAIILTPWKGDPRDRDLVSFLPFLESVAATGGSDVRNVLQSFEGKHIPTEYARREALLRDRFNKQFPNRRTETAWVSGPGMLSSALGMMPWGGTTMQDTASTAVVMSEGVMLQDQIRERGRQRYEAMEKEILEISAK